MSRTALAAVEIPTPVGMLTLATVSGSRALALAAWSSHSRCNDLMRLLGGASAPELPADLKLLDEATAAVNTYFAGDFSATARIPLWLEGASEFRRRVWDGIRQVGPSTTATYGALAGICGLPPGAVRAVGSACGANPCVIFVPCHRIVGRANPHAYAYGPTLKRALLTHEAAAHQPILP